MNDAGVRNLCAGIVERAIIDYIKALRKQQTVKNTLSYKGTIRECECFFRSEWFSQICTVNPEWLIRHCKDKAKSKEPIRTLSLLGKREE